MGHGLKVFKTYAGNALGPKELHARAEGFSHFGREHLLWLAFLGTVSLLTAFLHEKASPEGQKEDSKI